MITDSTLTCPRCLQKETETLYENVYPKKYMCSHCKQAVNINKGDCCIFCKFGDTPCLNTQVIGSSCCSG